MTLSHAQRSDFTRDGYVLLRGAVDPQRLQSARLAIARSLERAEAHGLPTSGPRCCLDLARHAAILALLTPLRTSVASLFAPPGRSLRALVGRARARLASDHAQIALRAPDGAPRGDARHGFHLDGFSAPGNGVRPDSLYRATVLVGIYLTAVATRDAGNLVVWPGSHVRFARFFRQLDAPRLLREEGADALFARVRAFDAGDPLPLEVEPGDAVLAHHLLGHGTADNLSSRTREAVYFRLLHPEDRPSDPLPMLDSSRFFA